MNIIYKQFGCHHFDLHIIRVTSEGRQSEKAKNCYTRQNKKVAFSREYLIFFRFSAFVLFRHFGVFFLEYSPQHFDFSLSPKVHPHRKFVLHRCLHLELTWKSGDVILHLIGVLYVVENNVVKQTPNMRLKQVYFTWN